MAWNCPFCSHIQIVGDDNFLPMALIRFMLAKINLVKLVYNTVLLHISILIAVKLRFLLRSLRVMNTRTLLIDQTHSFKTILSVQNPTLVFFPITFLRRFCRTTLNHVE